MTTYTTTICIIYTEYIPTVLYRIDDYLYNYYGGNEYERLTTLYNPESEETFLQG